MHPYRIIGNIEISEIEYQLFVPHILRIYRSNPLLLCNYGIIINVVIPNYGMGNVASRYIKQAIVCYDAANDVLAEFERVSDW